MSKNIVGYVVINADGKSIVAYGGEVYSRQQTRQTLYRTIGAARARLNYYPDAVIYEVDVSKLDVVGPKEG